MEWFQKADQLAPDVAPNLIGLAVASWQDGDKDGTRYAVERLLKAEPGFRIGAMHPLPYRDEDAWLLFTRVLGEAGAPC